MKMGKDESMEAPRILLADDEVTFLAATADLLRREGYHCDEVADAASAIARVAEGQYDLLITDLEMPGNADLQLVRDVSEKSGGLPVIILTGYPSVRSAVASIELPVAAYLTKPVSFPLLLEKVQKAVARFRSYQAMQRTEDRLRRMRLEINDAQSVAQDGNAVDVFLALTLRNVMGSLTDLQQLSRALNNAPPAQSPCQLMNCPRGLQLQQAVKDTVDVLEETKGAFKSKTLAELRKRLELLLEHA
jgi:DNA-binding response OmpR family regulator